jgi:hypothetical protein
MARNLEWDNCRRDDAVRILVETLKEKRFGHRANEDQTGRLHERKTQGNLGLWRGEISPEEAEPDEGSDDRRGEYPNLSNASSCG